MPPLLKKAGLDRSSPANYRPISNLSIVSKVLERLVPARLRPYLINSMNLNKYLRCISVELQLMPLTLSAGYLCVLIELTTA